MSKLNANTYLLKAISALTIVLTGFGGFASQAAQAIEQSCDIDTSTVLIGCDFQGRDLTSKSLSGYVIVNSNFSGANLQSANLQGVNLTSNIFSSNTSLAYANLSQANLSGIDLSGVNLTGATLSDSNISGANLTETNLTSANLTEANLNSANLTNAQLFSTDISNADLGNTNLSGLSSRDLTTTPTLLPPNWKLLRGYLVGPKAHLPNANLSSVSLSNLDLSGADLSSANLSSSSLTSTNLTGAKLNNANLYYADLSNTNFTGADLTGANLTAAYVKASNFTNATLVDIKRECYDFDACRYWFVWGYWWSEARYRVGLQEATLIGVKSSNFPANVSYFYDWQDWFYCNYYGYSWHCARAWTAQINLPNGWRNRNGVLIGAGANLSGRDYRNADFSNVDLSNVNFENTNISGSNFSGSTLVNADLSGKDLRNVDFSNANLSGAKLEGSKLDGAIFNNANLKGANFSKTDLTAALLENVQSGNITADDLKLPSGWKFVNGYFVGRTAQLYGADLSSANLSGMDLSYTNLGYANLSSTDLTGVNFHRSSLEEANMTGSILDGILSGSINGAPRTLPTGWAMIRGYLVGPKANLRGANLSGTNLSVVDLSGADLTRANLSYTNMVYTRVIGANLSYADLYQGDLRYADFTGANLDHTSLERTRFFETNFTNARLIAVNRYADECSWWSNGPVIVNNTFGWGLNFGGCGVNFSSAYWTIRNGVLVGPTANLSGTTINQLDLSNLNLSNANFGFAKLSGVNFSNSNLSNANFNDASLVSVDLSNADLTYATLVGLKSKVTAGNLRIPSGWVFANGTLIGAGARAVNVNLSGVNLEGLDLSGVDLTNSNLSGANLRGVNLSGATLRNANLSGADLSGANIELADFEGVVFGEVIADGVAGSPMNIPAGWVLQDGRFIGTIFLSHAAISGTLQLGQVLSAVASSSPVNVNYSYKWLRNGTAIEGAVGPSYQVTLSDLGSRLSVQVIAAKDNFISMSSTSQEVWLSNILPNLYDVNIQGQATKDGQLSINLAGNVSFSMLSYQLSRDGGRNWVSLGSPNYSIRFNDLGGNLNFRIIQSAAGYVTQVTELDPIAVDGSYSLPGFLQGSIDGANSGNEVEGGAKVGSVLRASKSVWPANTRVTGFWWSSNGSSVSNKLIYKSQAKDIDSQLVYVEVGVSETGVTKYRLSAPVHVLPLEFENSSKPVLVGSSSIGSRLKATITTGWSSGAKYFYQWLSNGEVIPSAVGPTYTITSEDLGSVVSVRACASKLGFLTKCEESSATGVIQKSQIFLSTKPSVKLSSTKLGRQLVATLGKWQTGLTFTYEWLRDGVVVPDETKTTYLLRAADDGHEMSFRVTASKPGYFDLTKASSPKVFK